MAAVTFQLRPLTEADLPFVLDCWVKSYQRSHHARACGKQYHTIQDAIAKRHIANSAVLVCCLDEDPETIVGWAVTGPGVVHYVYVKMNWRRRGVASKLLAPYLGQEGVAHTHTMTWDDERKPWTRVPRGWRYEPKANYGL